MNLVVIIPTSGNKSYFPFRSKDLLHKLGPKILSWRKLMRGNIQMRFFPVSKTEANCIVKELLKYIQYMDGKINLLILKRYYE